MSLQNNPDEKNRERQREYWYKVGITAFAAIIIWRFTAVLVARLATADLSALALKWDFNQLLSFCLAFFSILLSAMFYFKATDTSNAFYDQSYNFMKDLAEVLARIESGFGKQLENLEKTQTRIANQMESKGDAGPTLTKTASAPELPPPGNGTPVAEVKPGDKR